MKISSSAVKMTTVFVFTLLIVCFVCYRVGAFDDTSISQNLGISEGNFDVTPPMNALDTPSRDSLVIELDREMMSSSKSMRMSRPVKQDTTKKAVTTDTTKKKQPQKSNYMGSSKSAVIFEPAPQQTDTAKNPKK